MKIVFEWPAEMSRDEWETEAARLDELFDAWLKAPDAHAFQLLPGMKMHVLDMETTTAPTPAAQDFGPGMLDPSIRWPGRWNDRIAETETTCTPAN